MLTFSQNILVHEPTPNWHVKVADFGITKDIEGGSASSAADRGTMAYMAPEILITQKKKGRYTTAVDVWALGATTHCILTKEPPFSGDLRQMLDYAEEKIPFPRRSKALRRYCTALGVDFIEAAMAVDKTKRLRIDQVLAHEWLNEPSTESDASS